MSSKEFGQPRDADQNGLSFQKMYIVSRLMEEGQIGHQPESDENGYQLDNDEPGRDNAICCEKVQEKEKRTGKSGKRKRDENEFVTYIYSMLKAYGVKIRAVAIQAGVAMWYAYKLMEGVKHTVNRDVILAICFSIGMKLDEIQHALNIYGGLTPLDGEDARSRLIMEAAARGCGRSKLDTMLEKAGFPVLKVARNMEKAFFGTGEKEEKAYREETDTEEEKALPEETDAGEESDRRRERHGKLKEMASRITGYRSGDGVNGNQFEGWIRLKDEDGRVYQVEAIFVPEGSGLFLYHSPAESEVLEVYHSLEAAEASGFYPYFLELDRRICGMAAERMRESGKTESGSGREG